MTKPLHEFSKLYGWDGNNFVIKKGSKSGTVVALKEIHSKLLSEYDVSLELVSDTVNELIQEIKSQQSNNFKNSGDIAENLKQAILKENAFKDFIISKTLSGTSIVYLKYNGRLHTIETLASLGADVLYEFLRGSDVEVIKSIKKAVLPFLEDKKKTDPGFDHCVKFLLSHVFLDEVIPNTLSADQSLYPVTIEGTDILAAYTIPYVKQEVKFYDLNNQLQDLLKRIENHRYLCATIFGYLLGHDYPYLIYLKGEGGDGKSSFVDMLGRLFGGSIAPWQDNNQFSMANMYMRGIINIAESTNELLLQQSLVKSITGGNIVNIESKNKTGFPGVIKCLLIADSNNDLRLLGKEFEIRRLRYFRVSPPNLQKGELLTKNKYVQFLNSTPNEFLNYCRQCFEELSLANGTIEEPSNHIEIIDSLTDPTDRDYFKHFIEVSNKDLTFKEGLSISKATVFKRLKADYPKDGEHKKYVEANFKDYLLRHYKVKITPSLILGWGEVAQPTEKIGLPE